jgi:hypothetical protein
MTDHPNTALIIASCLSAVAALMHVAIVFGGPAWYRFFGAGERFARASAAGRMYPTVVTLLIAATLGIWPANALAGAGLLARPPILKAGLAGITPDYLLRGCAIVPLLLFARARVTPFLVWSSLICISYGAVHVVGVASVWRAL